PGVEILYGLGLLYKARDAPGLGPGKRPALGDLDEIAFLELVGLAMGVVLLRAGNDLAHHRVLHPALDAHRHRLLHLVADDTADQLALILCNSSGFGHLAVFSLMTVRTRAISRFTFFSWLVLLSFWVASFIR